MTTVQISLSRAHKVAERLKTRASECFAEALSLSRPQSVNGTTGETQVARLKAQAERALELLGLGETYSRALATLRARIGRENEARGINAMLAELDGVNRILGQKKAVLEQAKDDGITPDELAAYKPLAGAERSLMMGVTVRVLDDAVRERLAADVAALQKQAFSLSDRIAEANAQRMSIELDDVLAAEVIG